MNKHYKFYKNNTNIKINYNQFINYYQKQNTITNRDTVVRSFLLGNCNIIITTKSKFNINDQRHRRLFKINELKNLIYNSLLRNNYSRIFSIEQIDCNRLLFNSKISKIRNRCIVSGHPSSIAQYRLSRMNFRKFALNKLIGNIIKN